MKAISRNTDYTYRVEVCYTPGQYDRYKQDMGIVVVIDVLRATSAMVVSEMALAGPVTIRRLEPNSAAITHGIIAA